MCWQNKKKLYYYSGALETELAQKQKYDTFWNYVQIVTEAIQMQPFVIKSGITLP